MILKARFCLFVCLFFCDAAFSHLPQPPTWRTWLLPLDNLLKSCPAWLAVPAARLPLACKFFDVFEPPHLAKCITWTSEICPWHTYNGNYSVFQLISGCWFSSGSKFSLFVAQSVSVRHITTSHVSVIQLQSFGMHQKPTNLVCSAGSWSL